MKFAEFLRTPFLKTSANHCLEKSQTRVQCRNVHFRIHRYAKIASFNFIPSIYWAFHRRLVSDQEPAFRFQKTFLECEKTPGFLDSLFFKESLSNCLLKRFPPTKQLNSAIPSRNPTHGNT